MSFICIPQIAFSGMFLSGCGYLDAEASATTRVYQKEQVRSEYATFSMPVMKFTYSQVLTYHQDQLAF